MSRAALVTKKSFIVEQERLHPEATGGLTSLLYDVALAARHIAAFTRRAGLVDVLGKAGATTATCVNCSGTRNSGGLC